MYIKRTLADPEFSNLCDFSSFPQLYSDMRTKNTPYGNAVNETNPVLGPGIYGYIISRFGTQNKDNAVGDKYYLAVDASGRLYGGAQVNNAPDITWKRTTGICL